MNSILADINWLASIIWLIVTLIVYIGALKLYQLIQSIPYINSLLHPLVVSSAIIILLQLLSNTSVSEYQSHTQILSMMLGPATVALALPLYKQMRILMKMNWRVLVPIVVAGMLAPLLSWLSLYFFNTPINLQMTILVKSITTPLAMDTAAAIGGIPSLAAVFVISTGIVGSICGPALFSVLGVTNHAAQGTALGAVTHAVGTSKAVSISEQCTAFATLGLCVNGIFTALILPILFG